MRFIDADELKRRIRWDYHIKVGFELKDTQNEYEKLERVIDSMEELKPLERDIGKEPKLEERTSVYHETYADGTGAFKQNEFLEWQCPNCGWFVGELYSGHGMWHIQRDVSYCAKCGQKIDWTLPRDEEKQKYEEYKRKEREKRFKESGIHLDNMSEGLRRKHGMLNESEERTMTRAEIRERLGIVMIENPAFANQELTEKEATDYERMLNAVNDEFEKMRNKRPQDNTDRQKLKRRNEVRE